MKRKIVFIHGLWLTSRSWENFEQYFTEKGYDVVAPEWPRKQGDIDEIRRTADTVAGLGITEIADHYDQIVRGLESPPIIIGHSFGGLMTMILLDRGLGAAGVAMDPAPPKGILNLPLRQLKASAPALLHPSARKGVVALNRKRLLVGGLCLLPVSFGLVERSKRDQELRVGGSKCECSFVAGDGSVVIAAPGLKQGKCSNRSKI